jgi:hypothetical protein
MYQPARRFRSCVFCASTDQLTDEHVFGRAFANFLDVRANWIAMLPDGSLRKGSSPLTKIAPRMLCLACNRDKFGPLMERVLPTLKEISSGAQVPSFQDRVPTLRWYFERMAFLLDAYTSDYELGTASPKVRREAEPILLRNCPPLFSGEDRAEWLSEMAPDPRIRVSLGHHAGVLGLIVPMHVSPVEEWSRNGDGQPFERKIAMKRFSFVLKNLAACIELTKVAEEHARPAPASFRRIEQIAAWPFAPGVTYDDYYSLPNPPDVHQHRLFWSNPIRRMAAEAWIRRA